MKVTLTKEDVHLQVNNLVSVSFEFLNDIWIRLDAGRKITTVSVYDGTFDLNEYIEFSGITISHSSPLKVTVHTLNKDHHAGEEYSLSDMNLVKDVTLNTTNGLLRLIGDIFDQSLTFKDQWVVVKITT